MICLIFFRNHRFLLGVWLILRTRIADTDIPDMVTKFSQFSRSGPSAKITFAKFNFTVYKCQTILPIREKLIREIVASNRETFQPQNVQSYGNTCTLGDRLQYMPWRGLLGANSHSKKFKGYRAATGYYTVDKYIQDGQLRFDEKFKLFIGMQNECCLCYFIFPVIPGWLVGMYSIPFISTIYLSHKWVRYHNYVRYTQPSHWRVLHE